MYHVFLPWENTYNWHLKHILTKLVKMGENIEHQKLILQRSFYRFVATETISKKTSKLQNDIWSKQQGSHHINGKWTIILTNMKHELHEI